MAMRPKELAELVRLADIGELAGLVTHEFNDMLNTVLLHVALLEQNAPESLRPDLVEIRRQGATVAALVRRFQQYRQHERPTEHHVDLNDLVTDTLRRCFANASISMSLWPELPPLPANVLDLRRLVIFLLRNALAVSPAAGSVSLRTGQDKGKIILRVEDSGPAINPQDLPHVFDLSVTAREGTNSLELAACHRIVRRLQGQLHCEVRAEGGISMIATLPEAR
jgi:signal transduction histidine kinase